MPIAKDYTEIIGNTPLVYLNKVTAGCGARVAVKVEYMNPSCSVKDRAGRGMILAAEERGLITPGKSVLIEVTSGNTGISLAACAAVRGYKLIILQKESASKERRAAVIALGAHLILCPSTMTMDAIVARAENLAKHIPHAHLVHQFRNMQNVEDHYATTGPEIWKQSNGKVAAVVFGVGTGGTLIGVGKYLKEMNSCIDVYAAEPAESPFIAQGRGGPHDLQGIGAGFLPDIYRQNAAGLVKECLAVPSADGLEMARQLARQEGLLCGASSGANVHAAIQLAKRPEYRGKLIVTMLPSFGDRYFSTPLYEALKREADSLPVTTAQQDIDKFKAMFAAGKY